MELSLLLCAALFSALHVCHGARYNDYDVPADYDKDVPPFPIGYDGKKLPLVIELDIFIDPRSITVDEKKQVLDVKMEVLQWWKEHRLIYNISESSPKRRKMMREEIQLLWSPPELYVKRMQTSSDGSSHWNHFDWTVLYLRKMKLMNSKRVELSIGCNLYFEYYPLDKHSCVMDIQSLDEEVVYAWSDRTNISFGTPESRKMHPVFHSRYVVCPDSFHHNSNRLFTIRAWFILERKIGSHLLESYFPTALFVCMSWGSFLVRPEIVPGRMVLLVTTLLSLVTLFEASRTHTPPSSGATCLDVWILSCMMFVFFALLEYAYILMHARGYACMSGGKKASGDNATVGPEPSIQVLFEETKEVKTDRKWWRKVRSGICAQAWAICHDPTGMKLDQISIICFPLTFIIYNIVYWNVYLEAMTPAEDCPKSGTK